MKNTTDITGLPFLDRARQFVRGNMFAVRWLGVCAFGFLSACASVTGGVGPFGVAAAAGVPYENIFPAALGVVVGYTIHIGDSAAIRYIVAAVAVVAVRWLAGEVWDKKSHLFTMFAPFLAAVAVGFAGLIPLASSSANIYDWVTWLSQITLSFALAYFFTRGMRTLQGGITNPGKLEIAALLLCAGVAMAGLASFTVLDVSVGRVAAVLVILLASSLGGASAAAVAGLSLGFVMGMVTGDFVGYLGIYGMGGLLAGLFGNFGKLTATAAFVLCSGFLTLMGPATTSYAGLFEVMGGSVLYMVLPGSAVAQMNHYFPKTSRHTDSIKTAVWDRIDQTASALMDISWATKEVSHKLEVMSPSDKDAIYDRIANGLCRRCSRNAKCWQLHYNDTTDAITKGIDSLKKPDTDGIVHLPEVFTQRCNRTERFAAAVQQEYLSHKVKEKNRRKTSSVRSVVTDQFEGIAMFLEDIKEQIGDMVDGDRRQREQVTELFHRLHLAPEWVVCINEGGRLVIQASLPTYKAKQVNRQQLTEELKTLLSRNFTLPAFKNLDTRAVVTLTEKPLFEVKTGGSQVVAGDNKYCGDSWKKFTANNKMNLVISDGMGTGNAAAVDSAMATSLITRLIQAGLRYESALKLINSALLVKSGEESLATLDITSLNLHTGLADFYKAGAAPTIVRKGGKVGIVESTSLPAGILGGVAFEHASIMLGENDMILMMSDGAVTTGVDWIMNELEKYKGNDPEELCNKIAGAAKLRREDGREDDITVVCQMIRKIG